MRDRGYREFPLDDKAVVDAGPEGHVSPGCRSEERIQTASRGPLLITFDPDGIPVASLDARRAPRDNPIFVSSRRIC